MTRSSSQKREQSTLYGTISINYLLHLHIFSQQTILSSNLTYYSRCSEVNRTESCSETLLLPSTLIPYLHLSIPPTI